MELQFLGTGCTILRDAMAMGNISEVEFGMLKKHGDKLGWGTAEKAIFLDLATETYIAKNHVWQVEVIVRSLCHSRVVTADYVSQGDRFVAKKTILVLGQLGEVQAAWAELAQPALYLFKQDFNIIWLEVPEWSTSSAKWMRYGPAVILTALRELKVKAVKVLACGVGGSIFIETMRQGPRFFGSTHMVYNFDLPRGSKAMPFSVPELEEVLREHEVQLWFTYNDEEGVFERQAGTPMKAFEAVVKLQARLEGERRRGFRVLDYDEVLVTEVLNRKGARNVKRIPVGRDALLSLSEAFLRSASLYYELGPQTFQEDLEGGLPPQNYIKKKFKPKLPFPTGPDGLPELPALRKLRLGPQPSERPAIANTNRRRMDRLAAATLCLMPPSKRKSLELLAGEPKLRTSESAPALLADLEQTIFPEALQDVEGDEDRLVPAYDLPSNPLMLERGDRLPDAYRSMWLAVRGDAP